MYGAAFGTNMMASESFMHHVMEKYEGKSDNNEPFTLDDLTGFRQHH